MAVKSQMRWSFLGYSSSLTLISGLTIKVIRLNSVLLNTLTLSCIVIWFMLQKFQLAEEINKVEQWNV
jgi:hypothetical protein